MPKLGGKPDRSSANHSIVAVNQILTGFGEPGWDIVGDLPAGPSAPFENYHAFADIVLVVVGPAWRSAMTARRLLPMVAPGQQAVIVANRWRAEPDHPGLNPATRIPFDTDVADAERAGVAPIDHAPESPAIRAISDLADQLVSQEVLV
jgi:CO dehydrogenase maturation factor